MHVDIAHTLAKLGLLGLIIFLQVRKLRFIFLQPRVRLVELCPARLMFGNRGVGRIIELALFLRDIIDFYLQFIALLQFCRGLTFIATPMVIRELCCQTVGCADEEQGCQAGGCLWPFSLHIIHMTRPLLRP